MWKLFIFALINGVHVLLRMREEEASILESDDIDSDDSLCVLE